MGVNEISLTRSLSPRRKDLVNDDLSSLLSLSVVGLLYYSRTSKARTTTLGGLLLVASTTIQYYTSS